jgi:putative hydrolase of the HAD superfamily
MMSPDSMKSIYVFDLDDTLYKEADYRTSGFREVALWVKKLYGNAVEIELQSFQDQGEQDIFAAVCRLVNLPLTVKESLLWLYRLHTPVIHLCESTKQVLKHFESISKVVIVTDGRSVTQRLKLRALALDHLPVYISEEYESEKPNLLRFERIMNDFPASRYVYVADNPAKDFIAPNALGWVTIGLRDDGRNIHSQHIKELPKAYLPSRWINNIRELI